MARKKIRIILTNEEYNLLNDITRKTKTDCWFWLDKDKEGYDCVNDLENGRKVTLRFAVQQLNEAIVPDLIKLSIDEMYLYGELMKKLSINENPFAEEIEIYENVYDGNANGIFTD